MNLIHNQLPESKANGTCYNTDVSIRTDHDTRGDHDARRKGSSARNTETGPRCGAETRQAAWDKADHRG